jgi:uncharacterized cupin superfamily protein
MPRIKQARIIRLGGFVLWTWSAILIGSVCEEWLRPSLAGASTVAEQSEKETAAKRAQAVERLRTIPYVEKYADSRLNLKDPLGRMKRSDWNYFFLDQKNKFFAGYWEAEQGAEDLGADSFHELLVVLEGKLYVEAEGKQYVAKQGDTVNVLAGRKCRVIVKEPVRSFFVCCPVDDPLGYEQRVQDLMKKKGIE